MLYKGCNLVDMKRKGRNGDKSVYVIGVKVWQDLSPGGKVHVAVKYVLYSVEDGQRDIPQALCVSGATGWLRSVGCVPLQVSRWRCFVKKTTVRTNIPRSQNAIETIWD